jgi:DNA-binding MarR family transcriptional regulator
VADSPHQSPQTQTQNPTTPDPTEQGRWRQLHSILRTMDGDIARIYSDREVTGITPSQVLPLVRLARVGPMTIREMSSMLGVSHSSASQTVSALARAGYVRSKPGTDARTRTIALTAKGRALIPLLEAEWRATEAAIAELEDEIPYPMSQAARDIGSALERRSFYERVSGHLADPRPAPNPADEGETIVGR